MNRRRGTQWWADAIARAGLAFAFLYPAYSALSEPYLWVSYFPAFALSLAASVSISDVTLLRAFDFVQVVVALWLLSGWRVFWPALLAFVMLLGIVFFNFGNFEILFRDLVIAALALSIALYHAPWAGAQSGNA